MSEHEEERLRAVVDTAVDGVILIDSRGRVLMFNPACEKLFGYRRSEVVGQNVKMLMPERYSVEHDGYLDNYKRTREARIIGIGREVIGRRKDGSTFPMDLSVGEAKQDGDAIFVGIIHDLTERKRAEQAERDAASRLKAVVDTAVDGVILIDRRGSVTMFNPACEKLFGYAASEVIGQNVKMLMPTPYREQHDGYLDNFLRTREAKIIGIGREVVGLRKDGSTFPMDLSVGEAKQDGQSTFVGVIHDLTERKRSEEHLARAQKMEAVGQLSGGIAHDFNNLLTVIIGNAESLAQRLKVRPDLTEMADQISLAGQRGAELTQRLLAFGRKQVLRPVALDGGQLIESMRTLLRRALREDIELKIDADAKLNAIFADAGQLESALLNLSLNAQDAMPNGGRLTISTANVSLDDRYRSENPEVPPGRYVMISVTDNGEGMTPQIRERVFEPFFTTMDVGKGSGLGLSMVYGFVKQSNGHVTIYSEVGLGTTVRLYLPASIDAAEKDLAAKIDNERPQGGTGTILIVEDDPFVRGYAASTVEELGYRVVIAVDGHDALQKLKEIESIDILFSDVVMPGGVSGIELAKRAKEIRPNIRVLLTSGYAIETLASSGMIGRDVEILNKPYRQFDLARRLRDVSSSK